MSGKTAKLGSIKRKEIIAHANSGNASQSSPDAIVDYAPKATCMI